MGNTELVAYFPQPHHLLLLCVEIIAAALCQLELIQTKWKGLWHQNSPHFKYVTFIVSIGFHHSKVWLSKSEFLRAVYQEWKTMDGMDPSMGMAKGVTHG